MNLCKSFKVKLNYKHRKINFVVTLGPEVEHLTLNFVCKLVFQYIRFEIRISLLSLMLNQ